MEPNEFDKYFKEYQICQEEVGRLESNIWQTATLFAIGSGVGLFSVAKDLKDNNFDFKGLLIIVTFAIVISLVWLRFAKRWWSIQQLKIDRMSQLDEVFGFKQSAIVRNMDKQAMEHIAALKEHRESITKWCGFKLWFFYSIPDHIRPSLCRNRRIKEFEHEHRGIKPVTNALIWANILLWILILLFSIPWHKTSANFITLPNIIWAVLIIPFLFLLMWIEWRKP